MFEWQEFELLCRQYWLLFGEDAAEMVVELIKLNR